ncbi:hypothetical protein [Pelotomaculum sp. PtaB.Bin117]|uniref:hypothetical protein n=1 Tax=Pelotomaculum sp. PtaB.Bin117 TaxID=1811694 RepID=UPI0009CDFD43|nr:hypothetical protein [Pelotomaculum sp. PtaB.Bin117]OPX86042.1 MAG: hypothetical protein A4E54_02092 [Pelotomaculum sp. PtaB.Bin117]OPY61192.1 MAG: hypothetical protein A4E56_02206 [Pelotomaculum sp. PtaU1.Bin065]
MQIWEVRDSKITVIAQSFPGFRSVDADLLFVIEALALKNIYKKLKNNAWAEFKKLLRQGEILFYIMKNRDELDAMGYEELIDRLGIPWLGTCH